jgi:hypothetical protein
MLYLGHFSYTYTEPAKRGKKPVILDAAFTAVAEAGSPEEAAGIFEKLLRKMRKTDDLFTGAIDVYLEALVEVEKVPKSGFISHCIAGYPEDFTTYCTSLRGTNSRSCRVYTAAPEEEDREGWDLEPFLTFDA